MRPIFTVVTLLLLSGYASAAPPPSSGELDATLNRWQDCLLAATRRINDRGTDAAIVGLAVSRMCHREYVEMIITFARDFNDQQRTSFYKSHGEDDELKEATVIVLLWRSTLHPR